MFQIKEPPPIVREYYETLLKSHRISIKVTLLDKYEEEVDSFTLKNSVIMGNIDVDVTRAGATRLLRLEVLNIDDEFFFDFYTPSISTFWLNNFIKVEYGVWINSKRDYVWVPVGTFVIQDISKKGNVLYIDGADKASRFMAPFKTITAYNKIKKGQRVSTAIKTFLSDFGETKFNFTTTSKRVHKDLSFPPDSECWLEVLKLAKSANCVLFYDGDGYCTLREKEFDNPVYVYRIGEENKEALEPPEIRYDVASTRNWVHVKGKGTISAIAEAPRSHPFSPYNLDPDKPLYLPYFYENPYIDRKVYAQNVANSLLKQLLQAEVHIVFSSLVIPTLEEYDLIRIEDEQNKVFQNVILNAFNIPLTADGAQKIGSFFTKEIK